MATFIIGFILIGMTIGIVAWAWHTIWTFDGPCNGQGGGAF